ncbi:MAG: hypothetical protein J5645_08465 [Lachnospiraceae bacterium]|nr:hypothetical protein [Lachnospiraceae bacterium]
MSVCGNNRFVGKCGRCLICLLLLLCVTAFAAGCRKKPDDPKQGEFFMTVTPEGVNFQRGDAVFGKLVFGDIESLALGELSGEVRLTIGDETWLRFWQEDDKGTTRVYLTTPQGTSMVNSWPADSGRRSRLTVKGLEEYDEDGHLKNGFSMWLDQPQSDSTMSNVLFGVNNDGVLTLNIYSDILSEGEINRTIQNYTYTLQDTNWDTDHCAEVVSRRVAPNAEVNNPRYGTYSVGVSRSNGEEFEQMLYSRVGLEDEGVRYRVTCDSNSRRTAALQVTEDAYGKITVDESNFPDGAPFTLLADGTVKANDGTGLLSGMNAPVVFRYNGTTENPDSDKVIARSSAGTFSAELVSIDEVYHGTSYSALLVRNPAYRKHTIVRFTDPGSETTVDVPVLVGDWLPAEENGASAVASAVRLVLRPTGGEGWELYAFSADPANPSYVEGEVTVDDYKKGTLLGEITLGMTVDDAGNHRYTGDVSVALADGKQLSLRHKVSSGKCTVTADYEGNTLTVAEFDVAEEQTGDPTGDDAGDDAKNDDAKKDSANGDSAENDTETKDSAEDDTATDTALSGSRYVELPDYSSAVLVRKVFFVTTTQDSSILAMFMITNDGELLVRLAKDGKWNEGSVVYECGYRFRLTAGGIATDVTMAKTEMSQTGSHAGTGSETVLSSGAIVATESGDLELSLGEKQYAFAAYGDAEAKAEARPEITVKTQYSTKGFALEEAVLTNASGAPVLSVKMSGGELLLDGVSIDNITVSDPEPGREESANTEFAPGEAWKTVETEHFTCSVYICFNRRKAETTLDGTIVTPAKTRRIAWLTVTDRESGNRWLVPLGQGEWMNSAK